MADDTYSRTVRPPRQGRDDAQRAPATDPLVELARLIGQDDQLPAGRATSREPVREPDPPPVWPPRHPNFARDGRQFSPPHQEADQSFAPRRVYAPDSDHGPASGWPPAGSYEGGADTYDRADTHGRADPYGRSEAYGQEDQEAASPDHRGYDEPRNYSEAAYYGGESVPVADRGRHPGDDAAAHYADDAPGFAEAPPAAFARVHDRQGEDRRMPGRPAEPYDDFAEPDHGQGYDRGDYSHAPLPPDDMGYADQPPRRRRLAAVITVFAVAVLGTAGAYAYRTMYATPRAGTPPVIRADGQPNKIASASQSGDSGAGKQIYDRLGEKPQNERVVPREEQPVDIKEAARITTPRVLVPAANPPPPSLSQAIAAPAMAQAPPLTTASTGPSAAPASEPKKIRTVTIRPDQGVSSESNAARPTPPPPSRPATRSVQPPAAAAPVPLTPQAAPAEPAPRRQASVAPAADGGFVVQLSAQRSEEDAQASFRSMQARYPSVLSARQPIIRRKDLGQKGIFYGAQVGPFASREDAVQLCEELKAAGGTCIVQRN